jgi:hypothetical protein
LAAYDVGDLDERPELSSYCHIEPLGSF